MSDSLIRSDLTEQESKTTDSWNSDHLTSTKRKSSLEISTNNSSSKRKYEDDTDTFEGRQRRDNGIFDSSFCVSPWEFRRLKADLMESQAQRIKLEDRIDQLHKKNKETVIFFDKEKNEMKGQLESNRNTIKDLEYQINRIRKRETECREELNEKVKHFDFTNHKLNEKLLKLETEKAELNAKIEKVMSKPITTNLKTKALHISLEADQCKLESSSEEIHQLKEEIKILKGENKRLKLTLEEKEELCHSLEIRLTTAAECSRDYEEVQNNLQLACLRIKELEKEKEDFEEAKSIAVALSDKVLRIPELEQELNEKKLQVANLRQFLHNNIMLEEMVHDLKTKLDAVEDREKEMPALKAKIAFLELELEKWTSIAADFSYGSTRDSLRDYIESLQRKELTTSLEINSLNALVRSSEKSLSSLKQELESLKTHNEKLESSLQKLKVEVQVLRRKSVLVSRERDSYRQQLDLYEKDLTMTGLSTENLSNEVFSQMKTRIQNLELSIADYRKHVETLETRLKECQAEEPSESAEIISQLKEEMKSLEDENKMLSKIKDDLEQKLESKALRGEYLTSNLKILHFRDNPAAEAEKKQKEDMHNLREECEKLRARVNLLEAGEILNITQKVSEEVKNGSSQRIYELEKELQSANLKMQRLREVFKKTSQEFRDVSYMLLGYRIDLASNNKLFKLYNMYSSSPSDYLMFQQTKTGVLEMLGTTFAESLSKLVDEYLHKGNSIPAFLSAVTLELYGSSVQSDDDGDDKDNENLVEENDSLEPILLD